jgi:sugar phosphate isomerase/epimerase
MADRLSLAGWSLVRRFRRQEEPLALLDFPRVARDEFGFDAVELNSPFFAARDAAYLADLRGGADRAGVALVGIAVDGEGDLAALDPAERQAAVENHLPWLDAGATLGCQFVRANLGGRETTDPEAAVRNGGESFAALARAGAERGVAVVIENHWGLTANPENMARVFDGVNSPALGALLDFGNFPPEGRYEALARIAPYAKAVHAKIHDFAPDGSHTGVDLARCVGIVREAGYSGWWGIEFEGKGDEGDGIRRSKAVMEELLGLG